MPHRQRRDMYVSALKFLYVVTLKRPEPVNNLSHPKRPKTLPVILSPEEVLRVFAAIRSVKHKAIIAAAYAAGLRISEVCGLAVADIDSQKDAHSYPLPGKGKKDQLCHVGREPPGPATPVLPDRPAERRVSVPGTETPTVIYPPPRCARFCGRSSGRPAWPRRTPCTPFATALPPI